MRPLRRLRIQAQAPADNFPATTLHACLKQVDFDALAPEMRQALERCFPRFGWDLENVADSFRVSHGYDVKWLATGSGIYDTREGRYRRYAGGRDLPGARYYAVCKNESGDDGSTLCYELMSYWDSTTRQYPALMDSTVHRPAISEPDLDTFIAKNGPLLLIRVMNLDEVIFDHEQGVGTVGEVHHLWIPLQVFDVYCDNVLDLRVPAAQDWLASMCGQKNSAEGFGQLLPNLISPTPGGNEFHQVLGAWLRSHGCHGLVFPSARRDISVGATSERVRESDGWNFVRYDGAQLPKKKLEITVPYPWKTPDQIGANIFHKIENGVRSWRVVGPQAGEWGRINYEVRRSRSLAPPPSSTFNPFDDGRPLRCAAGTPFAPLK